MQQPIDSKIKQAQRKGAGVYVLSGLITLTILAVFALWLFFVKGFSLLIGPTEAVNDAKVELVSGLAWVGQSNVYTLGGEVSIRVSSPTFEEAIVVVNAQSPSSIEVMLLPSPGVIRGQALLGNNAQNERQYLAQTQWFFDGSLIHLGGELEHRVAPGTYELTLTNPYFSQVSQTLDVARAQTVDISPSLAALTGSINIDSVPQGMAVTINGEDEGNTPLRFTGAGGEYKVSIITRDFVTIKETIALTVTSLTPQRTYQLLPKPGVLNISAVPSDGLLLINNVEHPLGQLALAANKQHKVQYSKSGHSTYSRTVNVNKDEPTTLAISLEALYGELTINANVPASIRINGNKIESLPVSKRLLAVSQKMEISAPGYRSITRNVVPQANKNTNVNITLLSEFDARRAEGKPLFASSIGINMRKFYADAFTMGSPANETGRRRNEHQVDVGFSKAFWVSEKEITQSQFSAFLGAGQSIKSTLPVTGVSWLEAAQYCNWLSQKEGLKLFYRFQNGRYVGPDASANGYRLPTEAEWEWLAKKAKRSQSTTYVWGNQDKLRDNLGNFADKTMNGKQLILFADYEDGKTGVAEVGSYKADRVGLYDMDGNVSEWVHDFYTNGLPDMSKRHIDYFGSRSGDSWVIKGGNYETGRLRELRGAFREFSSSGKETVGFRIARFD